MNGYIFRLMPGKFYFTFINMHINSRKSKWEHSPFLQYVIDLKIFFINFALPHFALYARFFGLHPSGYV